MPLLKKEGFEAFSLEIFVIPSDFSAVHNLNYLFLFLEQWSKLKGTSSCNYGTSLSYIALSSRVTKKPKIKAYIFVNSACFSTISKKKPETNCKLDSLANPSTVLTSCRENYEFFE